MHAHVPSIVPLGPAAGWTPLHVFRSAPELLVLWGRLGDDARFEEPFFEETVAAAQRRPWVRLSERLTRLADLVEAGESAPAAELAGLVLHVSRCGSTLVSQSLARLPGVVALSEPRWFTTLLEDERLDAATRARTLRAAIRLFARPGPGESTPRRVFLKCEPRALFFPERLFAAFPGAPVLLLHREPVEVLVANTVVPVPEALFPGSLPPSALGPAPRPLVDVEEYAAFVQARYFARAADLTARPGVLTVDYAGLPAAFEAALARHFLLPADELRRVFAAARRTHAKDATRRTVFVPDAVANRAAATPTQRRWAAEWFADAHARLLAAARDPG